jgi:hypothetical protein
MLKELFVEKDIRNKLAALGNTPDAIAESLFKLGIKGIKKKACHCPIATYVSSLLGRMVAINSAVILLLEVSECEEINNNTVSVFIRSFDEGKYIFLEQKAAK